ncbi:MAG TPA: cytochrome c [Anaerolineales bacterium]|nr:cytochrome c [Anaerolineales bacterium]
MFSKFRSALLLVLIFMFAFAIPVFAGGWAVISLDELPAGVVAGEPYTVGFTVLQHGKTPMTGLYPTVTARMEKGDTLTFRAEPEGKPGHYMAALTFPTDGEWEWSIQAFTMDMKMPVLNVSAAGVASVTQPIVKSETQSASISPWLIIRMVAFALALAGLVMVFRRRSRMAGAFTGLFLLIGITSFIMESVVPQVEAQGKSVSEAMVNSSVSQVELGRQLFLAKGCITCHVNNKAASNSEYWTIDMGATNLSNFSASPEILFIRLKDPAAAKSDTQMPNLGLKETEINALIAFINSE